MLKAYKYYRHTEKQAEFSKLLWLAFSNTCRSAHLLLGRVVDGCQGDEAGDMLSFLLENCVIPEGANTICDIRYHEMTQMKQLHQPTCMGLSHNERPLVLQSGSEVSACQQGWQQQSFHKFLCLLPATETHIRSSDLKHETAILIISYRVASIQPNSSWPL